jgi:outer membrane protein TolC
MMTGQSMKWILTGLALLGLVSCRRVILPRGEPTERAKVAAAEGVFALPVAKRPLPDLSHAAPLGAALEYAFNANGEIESAYREWRAALERVPQAGSKSDPRLEFNVLLGLDQLKSFTENLKNVSLMIGGEQEVTRGERLEARGTQALALTQQAGEKFRAAKFKLQRDVTDVYARLALNEELRGITSDTLRLLKQSYDIAGHRYHVMSETPLTDLQKFEIEIGRTESEQRGLALKREQLMAELNGVLNRPALAPLGRVSVPAIAAPQLDAPTLLQHAAANNPELAALRKEIETRGSGQVLAELERKPDYTLKGSVGGFKPFYPALPELQAGFAMNLPINRERIRAGIAEALAMRQASEAELRARTADTQSRLVQALVQLRDAERVRHDFADDIIPAAERFLTTQFNTYGSGAGDYLEILDTQRTLIDLRRMLAQARADRLRALAELEQLAGEDFYQLTADNTTHD